MKKIFIFCSNILLFICLISCHKQENTTNLSINFFDFPVENNDSVKVTINPDSIYIVGEIASIPSGYMMYIYDKEDVFLITDKTFHPLMHVVHKGEGPGEVIDGIGNFGKVLDNTDRVSVTDPYTNTFYALDTKTGDLEKILSFPENFSKFNPFNAIKLRNGSFVSARGDFKYGLVSYNPNTDEIKEWPLGIESIDIVHPKSNHVSMRVLDYNEKNGIIAEIYGELPYVILHNETGDVVKILSLTNTPREIKENYDFIGDLKLTDDYIIFLWGDTEFDNENSILFMTYEGQPVKQIKIRPAQTFEYDEKNNRLLTTNVEWEDFNFMVYDLD